MYYSFKGAVLIFKLLWITFIMIMVSCNDDHDIINVSNNYSSATSSSSTNAIDNFPSSSSNELIYSLPFDTATGLFEKDIVHHNDNNDDNDTSKFYLSPDGMCYMTKTDGYYIGSYLEGYQGKEFYIIKKIDSLFFNEVDDCDYEKWGDCPSNYYQQLSSDTSLYIHISDKQSYDVDRIVRFVDSTHIWQWSDLNVPQCWSDGFLKDYQNMKIIDCDTVEFNEYRLKVVSNSDWIFENETCSKNKYLEMQRTITNQETCDNYVEYINEYLDCKKRNIKTTNQPIICNFNQFSDTQYYCINRYEMSE